MTPCWMHSSSTRPVAALVNASSSPACRVLETLKVYTIQETIDILNIDAYTLLENYNNWCYMLAELRT